MKTINDDARLESRINQTTTRPEAREEDVNKKQNKTKQVLNRALELCRYKKGFRGLTYIHTYTWYYYWLLLHSLVRMFSKAILLLNPVAFFVDNRFIPSPPDSCLWIFVAYGVQHSPHSSPTFMGMLFADSSSRPRALILYYLWYFNTDWRQEQKTFSTESEIRTSDLPSKWT